MAYCNRCGEEPEFELRQCDECGLLLCENCFPLGNLVCKVCEQARKDRTLHVYGQKMWHSPVYIIGSEMALCALISAIYQALRTGLGRTSAFVSDGEGYDIFVKLDNRLAKDWDWAVPYTDEIAQDVANGKIKYPWDVFQQE